ncbi:DUF1178 family protein [Pontibaca salina]|uniref:DUF1178 family protein n=1 Tax=Pontibaca salina TaxID=2795731 RepID=A0A934HRN3_9RHOB|nr:DUF1178 family protein [Pontibaca salina]MBI6628958.1 DUF1178 family protein [Pontibaca salina]
MIRYALKCSEGHAFDSWFQSADAYEKLAASGMIACAVCGSDQVSKAVMAPRVSTGVDEAARPLSQPASKAEAALAEIRRKVEENADYVGLSFAAEARAIHDGTAPERAIYGEARLDEARKLIEDGVQVAPLPFRSSRKMN